MRYLLISILLLGICGCASFKYDQYDQGYELGKQPDFSIRVKGKGDVSVKRLPDGTVETDVKAGKPLININNIPIKYENND